MTDDLARAILDELRAIRSLLEPVCPASGHTGSLARADVARLKRVLPAVAGQLGSEWFGSCDAFDHPSPALQIVLKGLSPRAFGRLLRRATGVAVDGYMVERGDKLAGAVQWRIVAAVSFRGNENVSVRCTAPRDSRQSRSEACT